MRTLDLDEITTLVNRGYLDNIHVRVLADYVPPLLEEVFRLRALAAGKETDLVGLRAEIDLLTQQLRTSNGSLLSLLTGIEALVSRGRLVLTPEEQAFVDRCHDAVFVTVEIVQDVVLGGAGDDEPQ